MKTLIDSQEWIEDCKHWRHVVLTGKYAHWCDAWDALPVDETTSEFTCCYCFDDSEEIRGIKKILHARDRERELEANL